jgi:hypothetical protein
MLYTETMNSFFHLCGYGQPHNRADIDALTAGSADVKDEPIANYLGYYD